MKKLISAVKSFAPVFGLFLPFAAFASPIIPPGNLTHVDTVPDQRIQSVQDILQSICSVFGWLFVALIALSMVFIVIAAFHYLTSGGDPEKSKKATSMILYAAIAVGVALLARAIPLIVISFLNPAVVGLKSC